MTGILLRILIFAVLGAIVFLGIRKIWRDWKKQFKVEDDERAQARLKRDRTERTRPDVITLQRGEDGTFRKPGDSDKDNG